MNTRIILYLIGFGLTLFSIKLLNQTLTFFIILLVFLTFIIFALIKNKKKSVLPHAHLPILDKNTQSHITAFLDVELLANALPDSLFIINMHNSIIYINLMAGDTFPSIRVNQNFLSRFRAPEIVKSLREARKNNEKISIDYLDKNNNERFFNVLFIPLKNDYFLILLRDRTENRNLERIRSDFIANASHELRTPLTSLRGFIETIKGPAKNDEKARDKFLTIMQEQAERMARLIDDLLSLSHLESKSGLSKNKLINLSKLLNHVVETLSPLAQNLQVKLFFKRPDDDIFVRGNIDELIQLFQNLIENACKYGQSGGKVEIEVFTSDNEVEIKIRDYGLGISEEHIPRLTERFYRANTKASIMHKGTGLGLSIVKHILTHHHGRLLVQSTVNKGATFTVILPLENKA